MDWQPGFWDVSKDEYYLQKDYVSASMLSDFRENREMFFRTHVERSFEAEKPKHFGFGTAFHVAILEPEKYDAEVAVAPSVDMRTNKGKEAFAEFSAANVDKHIISAADHELIVRMRDVLMSNADAVELLSVPRRTEQPARWVNEETGLWSRCMYDGILFTGDVIDLKSASTGDPRSWARDAGNFGYHRKQAWYDDGRTAAGLSGDFLFIVVSKEQFPRAVVARLDPDDVEVGRRQNLDDLVAYQACLDMERWAAPSGILDLKIPFYALE